MLHKIKLFLFKRKYRKFNRHNYTSINNICDRNHIQVGKKTYGSINVTDWSFLPYKLKIGSYCSIAPGVQFLLGGEHQTSSVSTYPFKVKSFNMSKEAGSKGDIIVEDDVWIGANVIICSGVTIGQGAIIGAGSVVTKNIEPYSISVGNPAKHLKYRFKPELRLKLQKINITKLFDRFSTDNIDLIYSDLTEEILDKILEIINE